MGTIIIIAGILIIIALVGTVSDVCDLQKDLRKAEKTISSLVNNVLSVRFGEMVTYIRDNGGNTIRDDEFGPRMHYKGQYASSSLTGRDVDADINETYENMEDLYDEVKRDVEKSCSKSNATKLTKKAPKRKVSKKSKR